MLMPLQDILSDSFFVFLRVLFSKITANTNRFEIMVAAINLDQQRHPQKLLLPVGTLTGNSPLNCFFYCK
jgi:hypothetical protein